MMYGCAVEAKKGYFQIRLRAILWNWQSISILSINQMSKITTVNDWGHSLFNLFYVAFKVFWENDIFRRCRPNGPIMGRVSLKGESC